MTPFFKRGDFAGGIQAGVNAIIAATKGEYKAQVNYPAIGIGTIFIAIMALIVISSIVRQVFGTGYASNGRSSGWWLPLMILSNMGSSRSNSSWGGGGGGGGWSGGGGFGGGGSTGGGGASGSW